jgi:ribonuclease HII
VTKIDSTESSGKKRTGGAKAVVAEFEPFDWQALMPAPVIGVDEVGRGCLAGPVYSAAAIVPVSEVNVLVELGVTDSKALTSTKRERLAQEILARCHVGIGFASAEEIDRINILQATFLSMRRALVELQKSVSGIGPGNGHILIDGNQRIPLLGAEVELFKALPQTTLVKGDLRALPIAAASIVAKVTRDRLMIEAATEFPQYGFEKHKGYAAVVHRQAIAEHGPTKLHRKSFGGVREYVQPSL